MVDLKLEFQLLHPWVQLKTCVEPRADMRSWSWFYKSIQITSFPSYVKTMVNDKQFCMEVGSHSTISGVTANGIEFQPQIYNCSQFKKENFVVS